jgi:hypothetical protein
MAPLMIWSSPFPGAPRLPEVFTNGATTKLLCFNDKLEPEVDGRHGCVRYLS